MKFVNYITQINLFIKIAIEKKLTVNERMLWLGIFWSANKLAQRTGDRNLWPDGFFSIDIKDLCTLTGLSERAIRKCRDILKDLDLIDYIKGDGKRSNPQYRLFYLKLIDCEIVPEGAPVHARDSAPDNARNDVGNIPSTSDKYDADDVCDQTPEAFNNKDSSRSPDSGFGTDTGSTAVAVANSETLKKDPGLQSLFSTTGFSDLETPIKVDPFAKM